MTTVDLPLSPWLNQWGLRLRAAVVTARAQATRSSHKNFGGVSPERPFRLAMDFSGLEAPLWALKACGVPVVHVSSCDIAEGPQAVIEANCLLRGSDFTVFSDILAREPEKVPQHDVYVAGFPCTPFSTMHNRTRLLRDPNARQFYACVRAIKHCRTKVAVLENVMGATSSPPPGRFLGWCRILLCHLGPCAAR